MFAAIRRSIALVIGVATLLPALTACGGGSQRTDSVGPALAVLSQNGVAVYETYDAPAPLAPVSGVRSALRLTRWQLANLVAQADAGMGLTGASMDKMEGPRAPRHAPGISYFIAAWIVRGASPLAKYAQHLIGPHPDYHHAPKLTFPLLVVTMFLADAARLAPHTAQSSPSRQSFFFQRLIAAPAQASGICSSITNFVAQTIQDVENALTVQSNGFFGTLWNTVVQLVVGLTEVVIGGVLYPLIAILNAVAGGLAAITAIASSLQPWTVVVQPQPDTLTLGSQPVTGKMQAVLNAPSIDWPSALSDCAQALTGVQLDKISYVDAPVTWTENDSIGAQVTAKDGTIGADKTATLTYEAPAHAQPPDPNCAQAQTFGSVSASARVERIDVIHAQEQLAKLVFGALPPIVQQHLMPVFSPLISQAQQKFAQLLATPVQSPVAYSEIDVLVPDSTKCTPSPQPSGVPSNVPSSAPGGKTVSDFVGTWACIVHQTSSIKYLGPLDVTVHVYYLFDKQHTVHTISHSGAVWSSVHKVDAEAGGPVQGSAGGSGPYSYSPIDANSGTLDMDGAHHLTWNGNDAFTMPSQHGSFHAVMHCTRM